MIPLLLCLNMSVVPSACLCSSACCLNIGRNISISSMRWQPQAPQLLSAHDHLCVQVWVGH